MRRLAFATATLFVVGACGATPSSGPAPSNPGFAPTAHATPDQLLGRDRDTGAVRVADSQFG